MANVALVDQFGFDEKTAGELYSIPYFMSAVFSPMLGIFIDRYGKRALMITISSALVSLACFTSAFLPYTENPDYSCLLPLIIIGFGYSIYASALWSSIPYVVPAKTIGSAFGLTTSIQQIGLVIAPTITGILENRTPGRFVNTYCFLGSLAFLGIFLNIWLYMDDIKNRNSVLDRVDKPNLEEMMTSPPAQRQVLPDDNTLAVPTSGQDGDYQFNEYQTDDASRTALKRSFAKSNTAVVH